MQRGAGGPELEIESGSVRKTAGAMASSAVRQRKAQRTGEEEPPPPVAETEEPGRGPARSHRSALLLLLFLFGLGLGLAALGWKYSLEYQRAKQEDALKSLGNEGMFLFSSFDVNNDLYLSPEEFKPLAEKLTGISQAPDYESDGETDPNAETLTIEAEFQPLMLESMTKSKDGFLGVSHGTLSGLRSWKTAETPTAVFSTSLFKAFLPLKNTFELGEAWWIIPSELNIFTGYLSNNRFYPPTPRGREVLIHKLLAMFHPRPFVKTRFAPQGAVACVRAVSDFYYDIVFRIHGEFQLNEPPDFPFWFTPGQFTGHVTLSKDGSHVRDFSMYVPNSRSLNVDMEWLYGIGDGGNMEVDIGYLPQMELKSAGPSIPSVIVDENGNVIDSVDPAGEPIQFVFEEIVWRQEFSFEEAVGKLETTFYPFKKVSYHPFIEAFDRAKAEDKLVHSILLWGALDDQSC